MQYHKNNTVTHIKYNDDAEENMHETITTHENKNNKTTELPKPLRIMPETAERKQATKHTRKYMTAMPQHKKAKTH